MKYKDVKGLTDFEVLASRSKHGSNELPPREVESFWDKLKENFEDPIIRILMVALGITILLACFGYADWVEGFGIAIAVFLATFVSTYSEYKNEASFRELQEQASRAQNTVFRNGVLTKVFIGEIVVGDMVLLQAGDGVPADGKLVFGEIFVDQSSLSGEKDPRRKCVAQKNYLGETQDYEDEYLCFRGSVVDAGEGVMRVDIVGEKSSYGQLYRDLADAEDRESPLQRKLSDLADGVATFGYIGATLIAVSFLFKQFVVDQKYSLQNTLSYISTEWHLALHDFVHAVTLAIIVIVVAVPEGLPMMIAIVLSLNMRKLLKDNVLVRKLLGIEAAGSLDILFVDKTGTLTRGVFSPRLFLSGDAMIYDSFEQIPHVLQSQLSFAIRESTSASIGKDGLVGGNSSDRALLSFLDRDALKTKYDVSLVREILFNSEKKFSAIQVKVPSGSKNCPLISRPNSDEITLIKGAPEIIIPLCQQFYAQDGKREPFEKSAFEDKVNEISSKGIRVIAVATSEIPIAEDGKVPEKLCLVGVVGIVDEIRRESKPALQLMYAAGIHVVMITGDRKETAVAVANELGLLNDGKIAITSEQLRALSDAQLQSKISTMGVIARALPTDKSRLVKVCKDLNKVIGMTGDGVNDSAALREADVGFSMGSGSEVAKEASSIVILDDNFQSITQAVLYGRTVFKSIRKFIVFQSTVNCASLMIVFMGPFLGYDFPLTLVQLLWVNLVMDTLAAIAFGGEPALRSFMFEKPIRRDEPIINRVMWSAIIINGAFIASLCIFVLNSASVRELFSRGSSKDENDAVFLTAFFAFFIFLTNFNAFNARTPKINLFDHLLHNQGFIWVVFTIFTVQVIFTYLGGNVLRTVGLRLREWFLVIVSSSIIIPFDLLRKIIINHFFPNFCMVI